MNDNPTREEVLASIVPKSDQLNTDDLVTGPITVTIMGVKRGSKEQPICVEIEGHQPFKPCKSMRRVLIAVFSDDPTQWVGQQMTLFCDPSVLFGGIRVGGIRISHLSGIDEPKTFLLTQTRGKKAEVAIHPIGVTPTDIELLKTTWGKVYHSLIAGLDKKKPDDRAKIKQFFDDWLTQIIGEHDPKMLADADGYRLWTLEHLAQCKRAVSDDSKEDSHGNDST